MAIIPLPAPLLSGRNSKIARGRTPMFETSYSVVEQALMRTYDIPDKALGAFRGRLGNLQKQGIFGPTNMPGRGRALIYTSDMQHRLIFACELFEFGVSP